MGSMEFPKVASAQFPVHARDEHATVRHVPHLVAPWGPWSFLRRQAYAGSSVVIDVAGVEIHDGTIQDSDTATLPLNNKPRDVTYQVWHSMGSMEFPKAASVPHPVHARGEQSTVRNLPHLVAPWGPWSFQRWQAHSLCMQEAKNHQSETFRIW